MALGRGPSPATIPRANYDEPSEDTSTGGEEVRISPHALRGLALRAGVPHLSKPTFDNMNDFLRRFIHNVTRTARLFVRHRNERIDADALHEALERFPIYTKGYEIEYE